MLYNFFCKITKGLLPIILCMLCISCGSGSSNANPAPTSAQVVLDTKDGSVANGQTQVSTTPMIVLQFSAVMDPSTISDSNITLSSSKSGLNPVTLTKFTANKDNTIFHFAPANPLLTNTTYYININNTETKNDIKINGNFSFVTGSVNAPVVSIITPANDATQVWNTASMQIHFSKSVGGVNRSNVHLHAGSENGPEAVLAPITQVADGSNIYTITLEHPMHYSTKYFLVLGSGITDTQGDQLPNTTFSFTTVKMPILYITDISTNKLEKCFISEDGAPEKCVDSGLGVVFPSQSVFQPINPIGALATNETGTRLYILNGNYTYSGATGNFMVQCNIGADGDLSNCNNANGLSPYLQAPQFLSTIKNQMYIFNQLHFMTCDTANDRFFCSPSSGNIFPNNNNPRAMVLNRDMSMAYVALLSTTDYTTTVQRCRIASDGSIGNCNDTGVDPNLMSKPIQIFVDDDNSRSYIFDADSNETVTCTISPDGSSFTDCNSIDPTIINSLGLVSQPLYFNKYINRLVFYQQASVGSEVGLGFATVSKIDHHTAYSRLSSDGSFKLPDAGSTITSFLLYR